MLDWTIVIPVKGTHTAKSRLGASTELAMAIALDSVAAAVATARVIVVTATTASASFEDLGARVVKDPSGGLNAAIRAGIAAAGSGGAGGGPVAVLLGDVPALQAAELAAALALAEQHPLAFVPDADGDGTVLITALTAADHAPAFGAGSRAAHAAAGYLELDLPADSGLRRDVDTPEHLTALASRLGPRTAARYSFESNSFESGLMALP
ncbi:MAG: 2-phospho-L-lactate/phosphoenolpyruvate guanylyltransferase, partial [Actinomycetota bacterium]|nr:2-phospho-L-lactate/phosphoenolpyruvate guanylyltransferase [Actinomycetota bacterium]